MSIANLPQILHDCGGTFIWVYLIGKLEYVFDPKGTPFQGIGVDTEEDGVVYFAVLTIHAFKFFDRDEYSRRALEKSAGRAVDDVYFSNGSVAIGISEKDLDKVGKEVIVYGLSEGNKLKIKRQRTKVPVGGYSAFSWSKIGAGWIMRPNKVELLDNNLRVVRGSDLRERIDVENGEVKCLDLPEEVSQMQEISALEQPDKFKIDISKLLKTQKEILKDENGNEILVEENDSNIQEYVETPAERVDISTIDMKLVKHLDCKELSKEYESLKTLKDSKISFRKDFAKKSEGDLFYNLNSLMDNGFSIVDLASEIRENYVNQILGRYNITLSSIDPSKGKYFVDSMLNNMYNARFYFETQNKFGRLSPSEIKRRTDGIDRIKTLIPVDSRALTKDFSNYLELLDDDIAMASFMIANVLGIGEDKIVANCNSCYKYDIPKEVWFNALIFTPYHLGMLGVGLKFIDCEKISATFTSKYLREIYNSFGLKEDIKRIQDLNKQYRKYLSLMENLSSSKGFGDDTDSETIIALNKVKNASIYTGTDAQLLKDNGVPLKLKNKIAVELVLGSPLISFNYYAAVRNPVDDTIIEDLNKKGVIVKVPGGISTTKNLEKDLDIYSVLRQKGLASTGITDEEIDSVVKEFEDLRGFKLESLQKEGIKLVKTFAGVLSGCAGSGKTTTSECMSMVLEKHFGDSYRIIYGTPTGKACRRLAEVVGGDVRTLHSLFNIGIDATPYLAESTGMKNRHRPNESEEDMKPRIYILDEMAMASSDLLYEVIRYLGPNDIIYFLGDIKQLPPIGRGVPFSILMNVLPCVELGVSKRAASGSLINYNCMLINFVSDGKVIELKEGNDFYIKDCPNNMIVTNCCETFKNLIKGQYNNKVYKEDEIQVITEFKSSKFDWATMYLNPPIQKYLRTELNNDRLLFIRDIKDKTKEPPKFYKNDRIIHLNVNSYDMCRYKKVSDGFVHFKQVPTFGAVNGEVGKLVHIAPAESLTFEKFDRDEFIGSIDNLEELKKNKFEEILDHFEKKSDNLRDDTTYQGSNAYFIIVQFYDNDLEEEVYVMYRALKKNIKNDVTNDLSDELVLVGGDLNNIDLAYALTAHKMQGSQAPAIIAVFGQGGSPEFVNRNMINVIITRSQEFVAMIGDVKGQDSSITKGRRKKASVVRKDFLNELIKE